MEKAKKPTNGQLTKKIKNALVFVEKDKNYKSVFFEDKMIRLEVTDDYCVISTGYHRHVFDTINPNQIGGYARPYLYTHQIIDMALEWGGDNGLYSYEKMLDYLQQNDKTKFNIASYYSWWLFNIFQPLYQIGETEIETFITYESFLHNIARSSVILSEKNEDMTNKQFIETLLEKEKSYFEGIDENVIFHKLTDEENAEQEIKALEEIQDEEILKSENDDTSKNKETQRKGADTI